MWIFNALTALLRASRAQESTFEISVIVPVFNKGRYLERCLDSILAQNVSLEIVCIDDCSTDSSPDILKKYSRQHNNIRVVRNHRNQGAAWARNTGISIARGKFLQFTDADDLLPPGSLECLHEAARRNGSDVVRGVFWRLEKADISDLAEIKCSLQTSGQEKVGTLLQIPELWIPWYHTTYLISRDLILRKSIVYPKLVAGEDPVFITLVLTQAAKICSIPRVTYCYRPVPRPRPGALAANDYVRHAEMVKDIYGQVYPKCWAAYRAFIKQNISEYIELANASVWQKNRMRTRLAKL
jgi:glycosyltransferase involved in cell wall biosynthesis